MQAYAWKKMRVRGHGKTTIMKQKSSLLNSLALPHVTQARNHTARPLRQRRCLPHKKHSYKKTQFNTHITRKTR
jgi:hypothetical protein